MRSSSGSEKWMVGSVRWMREAPHTPPTSHHQLLTRSLGIALVSCSLALACSREPSSRLGTDTAAVAVASDSSGHAVDVTLTPAQLSKVRVAPVTLAPFQSSVQTTGTVAFNGDRSTQVLAPVSGHVSSARPRRA